MLFAVVVDMKRLKQPIEVLYNKILKFRFVASEKRGKNQIELAL